MEQKTEKNENKTINNYTSFSWMPFWIAGFMFTLGYVGIDPTFYTLKLWEQIVITMVCFLVWPFTLGRSLVH